MCNGDKKPISHVTPSNGVNTTHARTPTLKEKKRFVFNLKTRFLRETNPRPSDFALGRPTTELQYSIMCYTIMKFICDKYLAFFWEQLCWEDRVIHRKREMFILPDLLTLVVFHLLDCSNFLDYSHENRYINLYKQ